MLAVGHDELSVGDNEDVSSEAAEGWCTRWGTVGNHVVCLGLVMWHVGVPASQLRVSERSSGTCRHADAKIINWSICNHYICILLIKTNPMIYNMLYKI